MFNKKIVSLISALAMALSMCSFVSVQAADIPAADFELKVEKNIFDQDTYNDGYQEYTITVSLVTENIALTDNGKSGALKRYSGSKVTSFAGKINYDTSKFYTEKAMMNGLVSGGSYTLGVLDTGATFNWYTTDATAGLQGNVELIKINLYAMDAEGNSTMSPEDEFESLFTWDTTSRSIYYCEWDNAKASELALDSAKLLSDNNTLAGWVGNVGIAKAPAEPIEIVGDRYDLTDGFAWDVQVNEYAPAKTYTATFTDVATAQTKINDFNFSNYVEAEEGATFAFVTLLKTTKENVNLVVSAK